MINVAQCKRIQIPESREFLIVESGIMSLAILNTAQRIRNPTLMRLESEIQVQLIKNHGTETSTFNPESTALIRDCSGFNYMGRLLMIPDTHYFLHITFCSSSRLILFHFSFLLIQLLPKMYLRVRGIVQIGNRLLISLFK